MPHPTVDIIVPVWNNPIETRECLAAVLSHSPEARLIIIDNGSSRQTQLVLEEFSESLGDNALVISSERNVGLVRAINMGLARSESDYTVILRPPVVVTAGWLSGLLEAARTGIASPLISFSGASRNPLSDHRCDLLETCDISFSALALKGDLRMLVGGFDEQMDGAEWCLKDFVSRAWSKGYRTCITALSKVICNSEPVLGSATRRGELALSSRARYQERWGIKNHYLIYFGQETEPGSLVDTIETILDGCRQGHHFTLLLHRRQMVLFRRRGWNGLHTGIELRMLSRFMPERDLRRSVAALRITSPDLVLVSGTEEVVFPSSEAAISFKDLAVTLTRNSACPGGAYTFRGNAMIEEIRNQLQAHQTLFGIIEAELSPFIGEMAALLVEAFRSGKKLLVMGNGGSAADSQHFVAEMVGRFKLERAALPAVALSTDTSILTAIGNDYGFDAVFSRQVEALAAPGDVLVGISTSGNSPNVLKALELGRVRGCRTIGLLGKDGGIIKPACDLALIVPSLDTPRIQEGHSAIIHIVCDLVEKALFA